MCLFIQRKYIRVIVGRSLLSLRPFLGFTGNLLTIIQPRTTLLYLDPRIILGRKRLIDNELIVVLISRRSTGKLTGGVGRRGLLRRDSYVTTVGNPTLTSGYLESEESRTDRRNLRPYLNPDSGVKSADGEG